MTTRLFFHATNNAQSGLPTTEQSSLTVDNNGDIASKNRLMDTTAGAAENTIDCATNATTSAQVCHFTRFCSKPFADTSISANTWNYVFGAEEDNVNANFPCSGSGKDIWVSVYVWNPNTSTKVGNIIDGLTATGTFTEPTASASPTVVSGTFGGSAVNSIPSGCVIVYECMFQITQNNTTARTLTFHYDGPTVDTTSGDAFSGNASFIETPQNLTFQTNAVKSITQTLVFGGVTAPVRRKTAKKINSETITVTGPSTPIGLLRNKIRVVPASVTTLAAVSDILAHHINITVPTETITISSTPSRLKTWIRIQLETVTINAPPPSHVEHVYRPFRILLESIALGNTPVRKATKTRRIDE